MYNCAVYVWKAGNTYFKKIPEFKNESCIKNKPN